ncbi:MAG: radical SAM protein [Bryobacterales bacterium]|nr:radical SAM protein [Bryobacterales bacterium]MBV9401249.1 radical SAM protein [Bryobacterales bacterium]
MARHSLGSLLPVIIQPDPREIDIALTANCNLRCKGCRYGRDFMPGAQLPWEIVRDIFDDAKEFGIPNIRLYGGEPLLHKYLVRIVKYGSDLGLNLWMTTNGMLLRERIDDLYQAGLRTIDIGFYGTGDAYDAYVQRPNRFASLEAGVAYTRQRYGTAINLFLAWVLMRPTCTVDSLRKTWEFAEKYNTPISVNLIHYSLPYFTEGVDRELQFRPEDRPAIEEVVDHLISLKEARPQLIAPSVMALRSVPDWLIKGPDMAVPCDKYRLIWVGADGTVQLCYVTFRLGNLHEKRLREMLFTPAHYQAAGDAFALRCPRCHCGYPARTEMHVPSRWKYSHDAFTSRVS